MSLSQALNQFAQNLGSYPHQAAIESIVMLKNDDANIDVKVNNVVVYWVL